MSTFSVGPGPFLTFCVRQGLALFLSVGGVQHCVGLRQEYTTRRVSEEEDQEQQTEKGFWKTAFPRTNPSPQEGFFQVAMVRCGSFGFISEDLGLQPGVESNNRELARRPAQHVRRPHSSYQRVVQGKCPTFIFLIWMGSFARTHFSRTLLPWPVLCYSGEILHARFSNTSFARTLLGSNFGGLLLEQIFCWDCAAFPTCDNNDNNNGSEKREATWKYGISLYVPVLIYVIIPDFLCDNPSGPAAPEQIRKIPAPIKIKSSLPPPPPKPKIPPP